MEEWRKIVSNWFDEDDPAKLDSLIERLPNVHTIHHLTLYPSGVMAAIAEHGNRWILIHGKRGRCRFVERVGKKNFIPYFEQNFVVTFTESKKAAFLAQIKGKKHETSHSDGQHRAQSRHRTRVADSL